MRGIDTADTILVDIENINPVSPTTNGHSKTSTRVSTTYRE